MTFFTDNDKARGPRISDALIAHAEERLGVRLPRAYLALLAAEQNGGTPKRRCFRTNRPTSWARNHFQVQTLIGIGYADGIDGEFGSEYLTQEWGYPRIGVVLFDTPAAGPDVVMLDYTQCGHSGEPGVCYIDEDRSVLWVADDFAGFVASLVDCSVVNA